MPSPDPEPENYSIDDIMDRLRSRGDGGRDGEAQLVTREDGTQVYRMRKRKRRSRQPKKEKERRHRQFRVAQIVVAVGLVVLTGLVFLGSFLYLNSSGYKDQVNGRIRTWTGAEPKLTGLTLSPVSVGATGLELKWPESSVLDNLRCGAINGSLEATKLPSGKWKGHELYSGNGQLVLRKAPWEAAPRTVPAGECPFEFRYCSSKFSVLMGDPERPLFRVRDSEATLTPLDPKAGTANLQFKGGNLESAQWGNFDLTFASLQFEGGKIKLGNLLISPGSSGKGELQISNPADLPLEPGGEGTALVAKLERISMNDLLGSAFGNWLVATVETPDDNNAGKLVLRESEKGGLSLRAPFRNVAGNDPTASALPMFEILSSLLKEPWYQRPRFESARGELVKDGEVAGVENINFETRSRLALGGRVVARRDGKLEGTLEVGLPVATVGESTSQLRALFTRRGGDFLWASFEISGNTRAPEDDMAKRLSGTTVARPPSAGGNGEALEDAFRELTTPARPER